MGTLYEDSSGRLYATEKGANGYRTACYDPKEGKRWWLINVPRTTFERAQRDLDEVARINGWKPTERR